MAHLVQTCFTCGNEIAKGEAYELRFAEGFERTYCAKCNEEREHYQWDAEIQEGYDYRNQAWVVDGRYVACSHPASMKCNCYGTVHAGEPLAANADVH